MSAKSKPRPVLFLDFDDVLCLNKPYKQYSSLGGYDVLLASRDIKNPVHQDIWDGIFDPEAKNYLKLLNDEFRPFYVLSTSWRDHFQKEHLKYILDKTGLGFVRKNFHRDWRTSLYLNKRPRENEILDWLSNHKQWANNYVIVDDEYSGKDWYFKGLPCAVICQEGVGITEGKYHELRAAFLDLTSSPPSA